MNDEMLELGRLYQEAWDDGVWFREWETRDGRFLAAAGLVSELEAAEQQMREQGRLHEGEEITQLDLTESEIILAFTTFIRVGETRVAACRAAWNRLRKTRHRP